MFELTREEYNSLRSHFVTLETGKGKHSKYSAFAFTELRKALHMPSAFADMCNLEGYILSETVCFEKKRRYPGKLFQKWNTNTRMYCRSGVHK